MVYIVILSILALGSLAYYLYKSKYSNQEGDGIGSLEDRHKKPREDDDSKIQR